jgi:hypothetical protein
LLFYSWPPVYCVIKLALASSSKLKSIPNKCLYVCLAVSASHTPIPICWIPDKKLMHTLLKFFFVNLLNVRFYSTAEGTNHHNHNKVARLTNNNRFFIGFYTIIIFLAQTSTFMPTSLFASVAPNCWPSPNGHF